MRDTIDMAREAGFDTHASEVAINIFFTEELKAFAELVRADEREEFQRWFDAVTAQHKQEILAEREACAKLAATTVCDTHLPTGVKIYGTVAAKAIRDRGNV
jgi:hypothetical protein